MSVWPDNEALLLTVDETVFGADGAHWRVTATMDLPYVTFVNVNVAAVDDDYLPRPASGAQTVRRIEIPHASAGKVAAAIRAAAERARTVARALDAAGQLTNDDDLGEVLELGVFPEGDIPHHHPQVRSEPGLIVFTDAIHKGEHDYEVSGPIHAWTLPLTILDAAAQTAAAA